MQPPPSIEELRLERPDLTDEQLCRREGRIRLMTQLRMFSRLPADATEPPHDPDAFWADEERLSALMN
ncbi:hypothetical protein [Synechococcus sp. 1G10]|uniref:hypothetical protein n=1 Tax=Synechococcus sp. 1G10 TaxID=2025605 RepID=UPI000B98A6ED|nr:hypothetical protein [Synechococcus sp. 1G10]